MGLEELRAPPLVPRAARRRLASQEATKRVLRQPTPRVTHFLQQGHTCLNKATSPNSATPRAVHIKTITKTINTLISSSPRRDFSMLEHTLWPFFLCHLLLIYLSPLHPNIATYLPFPSRPGLPRLCGCSSRISRTYARDPAEEPWSVTLWLQRDWFRRSRANKHL